MQTRENLSRSRLFVRDGSEAREIRITAEHAAKNGRTEKGSLSINQVQYLILTKGVYQQSHNLSGLLTIGYRINYQRSDGKQEVMTRLNTISLWGGVAHLTNTKGKHLGNNHTDELPGGDETYARTLITND